MAESGNLQFVTGSPQWRRRQLDMRRLEISRTGEEACRLERRMLRRAYGWLAVGVAAAMFFFCAVFPPSVLGIPWIRLNPAVAEVLKSWVCGFTAVTSIVVMAVTPIGCGVNFVRWLRALAARRRALYPIYHPDFESGGELSRRPTRP